MVLSSQHGWETSHQFLKLPGGVVLISGVILHGKKLTVLPFAAKTVPLTSHYTTPLSLLGRFPPVFKKKNNKQHYLCWEKAKKHPRTHF